MADVYKKISEYNELAELDASGKMLVAQSDETYSVGADTMAEFVKGRIPMDTTPTQGSSNPVTSNGVYNGIRGYTIRDRTLERNFAANDLILFQNGTGEHKAFAVDYADFVYNCNMPIPDLLPDSDHAVQSQVIYNAIEEVRALTGTDDTLSVEDKPADAKAAGDRITALETTPPAYVYKWNSVDVLENKGTSRTNAGITFTKNTDGSWTISGTATSNSAFCNLINSANAVPTMIVPGRTYRFEMHGGTVPIRVYFYVGLSYTILNVATDRSIKIPENITGMIIRYQLSAGDVVNETVHYSFTAESDYAVNDNWLDSVNGDLGSDETTAIDRSAEIVEMLNATGYCHLGPGVFYVSGIDMPAQSTLVGCGYKTVVRLLSSVEDGCCIKMQSYCTVRDLSLNGNPTAITPTANSNRDGIRFIANYDGSGGTSSTTSHCEVSNVWIRNFRGSGILCHNTAISVSKGLHVSNAYIMQCYAGINIDYYSEFNKFEQCCINACYYGCINNGGNNVFANCTFHASSVAFYIDGTQPNSGHGTIVGCTFCHSGSNNGIAIKIDNAADGFIISNCQIWYNSVEITNSTGILLDACQFGRGTSSDGNVCASITVSGGKLVLFSGCMFHMDTTRPPKITITNNTKVVFSGCYGTESGSLITA